MFNDIKLKLKYPDWFYLKGNDISGTRLGEDLYLRIELDGDSIFDIFARNLVAQSGVDDETIVLLDDRGCPADPVFPGLQKEVGP